MKKLIIASTSTLHGGAYLQYLLPALQEHFAGCSSLLFVPYARPGGISHDDYTKKAAETFAQINISVKGLHEFENPEQAVADAQAIFIGGGNTFLLVTQLYANNIMTAIQKAVNSGTPYL